MNKSIYMDYAAATPLDNRVLDAMMPYFAEKYHNPSAIYLAAKEVTQDIVAARALVAHHLGARPAEIVFVAGGTEANNLAISGVMDQSPQANIITSNIEHESVLLPAQKYAYKAAPVHTDGRIDIGGLENLIDDQTALVSIMYANNEIGTIQPIKRIAQHIAEVRKCRKNSGNKLPLYLHVDACQATLYLDLHVVRMGADLMTINGGKMYGPKQSGALYVRSGVALAPQVLGGGQEFGIRSGTENVANIIGLSVALEQAQARRSKETERLVKLQKKFIWTANHKIKNVLVNGSDKYRLPNNVHITIPNVDNERLIMALDESGIQAAAGSACSASSEEPSHVLKAIGLSDAAARSSLRFTLGRGTTTGDINTVVDTLAHLVV